MGFNTRLQFHHCFEHPANQKQQILIEALLFCLVLSYAQLRKLLVVSGSASQVPRPTCFWGREEMVAS